MSGSAPLLEWDWDYLIHWVIGAAITAAFLVGIHFTPVPVWIGAVFMVPIAFGAGILREVRQHEPDPLSAHQWAEALLFGVGSICAAVPCLLLL